MEDTIDIRDKALLQLYQKCLTALRKLSTSIYPCTSLPSNIPSILVMSGRPKFWSGRPKVLLTVELYELMMEAGYKLEEIADTFGISRTTLWRRLKDNHITVRRYSDVSDSLLDNL